MRFFLLYCSITKEKVMKKLTKKEVIVNGEIWTKERLQELISRNETALYRALMRIYHKQTQDEKDNLDTRNWNTVGFSGVDGHIMTSIASHYENKGWLSPKQKQLVQKKMQRYCGQLLRLMAEDNRIQNEHFFKTRKKVVEYGI